MHMIAPLTPTASSLVTRAAAAFALLLVSAAGAVAEDLPPAARAYLRALEELAGCPISIVSTGPDRAHTMVLQDPFS